MQLAVRPDVLLVTLLVTQLTWPEPRRGLIVGCVHCVWQGSWSWGPEIPIAVHGMNPVVDPVTGKVWIIGGGTNGGYGMSSLIQTFDLPLYTGTCDDGQGIDGPDGTGDVLDSTIAADDDDAAAVVDGQVDEQRSPGRHAVSSFTALTPGGCCRTANGGGGTPYIVEANTQPLCENACEHMGVIGCQGYEFYEPSG